MLGTHVRKGSSARRGRHRGAVGAKLVAAAVLLALPSAAQDRDEEEEEGDAPAGDVQKAEVQGVVVRPVVPDKPSGQPVTVILGETARSRRELVVALPVGAGSKASGLEARAGTREIESSLTGGEERYDAWVRGSLREESVRAPGGIVVLAQVASGLEISCPREVQAGEAITLEVSSVGEVDDTWKAWLVYPCAADHPGDGPLRDGSRYEEQSLTAGDRRVGEKRKHTATFTTFPADRGKLLGVYVERQDGGEKQSLWVNVK